MGKFVSVGKILNFHGIKGEAKVGFTKNQADFFCSLNEVFVKSEHDYKPLKIISIRLHKNIALVKFDGINSINELMDAAEEVKDRAAMSFLNWYLKEQVEEEDNAGQVLATLKLIGDDKKALLMLDKELAARTFVQPVIE